MGRSRMVPFDVDLNDHFEQGSPQEERIGRRERYNASTNRNKVQEFRKTYIIKKKEKVVPKRKLRRSTRGKPAPDQDIESENKIE